MFKTLLKVFSVTVIVFGNGIGDLNTNPELGCLHFICVDTPRKGMNPSVHSTSSYQ